MLIVIVCGLLLLFPLMNLMIVGYQSQQSMRQMQLEEAVDYANEIEQRLNEMVYATHELGAVMKQRHKVSAHFEPIAQAIMHAYPFIKQINAAPDGVIAQMLPLEPSIIGLNLLAEDAIAQRALDKQDFSLSAPVGLRQGGMALIGRLPVFLAQEQGEFWGFVSVLAAFPDIFESVLTATTLEKYDIQITHDTPKGRQIIYGTPVRDGEEAIHVAINFPDQPWTLSLAPKKKFPLLTGPGVAFSLLFSALMIVLVLRLTHLTTLKRDQRNYYHELLAFDQAYLIAEVDLMGNILSVNDNFASLTGYSTHELVGQRYAILRSGKHDNAFYKTLWTTILAGNIWRGELCNKNKNQQLFWIKTIIVPLFDEANQRLTKFIAISRDISLEKQLTFEKEAMQGQLIAAQKLETIGQLTSGLAHDFNNVLMAISGFTSLAMRFNERQQPEQAIPCLQKVEKSCERAADLIAKMMTFARDTLEQVSHPIDPSSTLEEVVSVSGMLRAGIQSSIVIRFENLLPTESPPLILIDPSELHQLVTNLVVNAKDAIASTGKDKGSIHIYLFAKQYEDERPCTACGETFHGNFVVVSVSDTGTGIAPDKIHRIFDPFFTTKSKGEGTGLGLAMVSRLMHQAGGHLLLDSQLGEGATLSLVFPFIEQFKVEPTSGREDEVIEVAPLTQPLRICVVDDEPEICMLLAQELTLLGYQVTTFHDAISAFTAFIADINYFDGVISDYTMPKVTGFELAMAMLAMRPSLPLIICTGGTQRVDVNAINAAHAQAHVWQFFKPVQIQRLHHTFKTYFEGAAMTDPAQLSPEQGVINE
jgi:PAS domain S-box-containing protein